MQTNNIHDSVRAEQLDRFAFSNPECFSPEQLSAVASIKRGLRKKSIAGKKQKTLAELWVSHIVCTCVTMHVCCKSGSCAIITQRKARQRTEPLVGSTPGKPDREMRNMNHCTVCNNGHGVAPVCSCQGVAMVAYSVII